MINKRAIYNAENEDSKKNSSFVDLAIGSTVAYFSKRTIFDTLVKKKARGFKAQNLRFLQGYGPAVYNRIGTEVPTIGDLIWNSVRGFEETLLKFPRAVSGSTFFGAKILSQQETHISYESIRRQSKYLEFVSNRKITDDLIKSAGGLYYKDKTFFLANDLKNPVLKGKIYPGISFRGLKNRDGSSAEYLSRFIKTSYGMRGLSAPKDDFFIFGGASKFEAGLNTANTIFTNAVENYMRLLDDPFEFIKSFADIGKKSNRVNSVLEKMSGAFGRTGIKNLFGVGGYSELRGLTGSEMLMKHLKVGLPRIAAAYGIYKGVDYLLKGLFKGTVAGTGIKGIAAKGYQDVTKTAAGISDTLGLTYITQKQEEEMPGSTSLLSTAAFPASFGIAGLTLGYFLDRLSGSHPILGKDMPLWGKSIISGIESSSGTMGKAVKAFNLSKLGRKGMYGLIGAAIGLAVELPTLPGKLGSSKTRKELEDEYSGKRLVAHRRGEGWLFGNTPFEGGDVSFFAPHWSVQALTMAGEKSRTPEFFNKFPLLHPLAKVLDPYVDERLLDKERPYAYWGSKDYGFGVAEELVKPIKELIKPTVLAHPEGLFPGEYVGVDPNHPGVGGSFNSLDPSSFGPSPVSPNSLQSMGYDFYSSGTEAAGFFGFLGKTFLEHTTGVKNLFQPLARYSTSGQIDSASRAFWDSNPGDMLGSNEIIRRMIWHRDYGTDYVSSTLQNDQPSWIPKKYKTGDPYASIPLGDIRLPGRGFAAIHPDVEGVSYEDYPDIYKLMILNDVDPQSKQFGELFQNEYKKYSAGQMSEDTASMLEEIIRERKIKEQGQQFDEGNGILGNYYLALKKIGRALPTESLFPLSPAHKFAGPVDALSEYKDKYLLDSAYKDWSHPYRDFIRPAFNKTIDMFSLQGYTPGEATEKYQVNLYFQTLQHRKNQLLLEKSSYYRSIGDNELAKYYQSKQKTTIFDVKTSAPSDEILAEYSTMKRSVVRGLINSEPSNKVLKYISPDLQHIVSAQWTKRAAGLPSEAYSQGGKSIGSSVDLQFSNSDLPNKDYLTYAPGVDLNAFKVKLVNNMGESVRKYDLWHNDEVNAMILDDRMDAGSLQQEEYGTSQLDNNIVQMSQEMTNYGFLPNSFAIPSRIHNTSQVDIRSNDYLRIKKHMENNGWVLNNGGFY